jgi:hypothetical protein
LLPVRVHGPADRRPLPGRQPDQLGHLGGQLVEHLYLPAPASESESDYYYRKGVNRYALIAFVPAAVLSLTLAVVPAFSTVAPFGWFIGCGVAAAVYFPVARGRLPLAANENPREALAPPTGR